jgi:copper chaperone
MKTLKFKTNINCGGCVSKVTPFLNKQEGVESWEVDVNNPDKILKVKSKGVLEEQVVSILDKIGFKGEKIN